MKFGTVVVYNGEGEQIFFFILINEIVVDF